MLQNSPMYAYIPAKDVARARRFYERAGFAPDGATNVLTSLAGVLELRYHQAL